MSVRNLLPARLLDSSISRREIVLPLPLALEAIDLLEARGVHILGWEGWVKDGGGRVGHGSAPHGTASLDALSLHEAAQLCRTTIPIAAAEWAEENMGSDESLYFCITARA